MITYVNNVFVVNSGAVLTTAPTGYDAANIGKLVIVQSKDIHTSGEYVFRFGQISAKSYTDKNGKHHVIRWSNPFKQEDVISMKSSSAIQDKEDTVEIDFTKASADIFSKEGNRLVLRLQFKDLPTRYRQWSESYEVITTSEIKNAATVAKAFKDTIDKNFKRARVIATADAGKLTLEAMPYDDDDTVDSISWAAKVRFSATMWYTKPYASGFDSKNKYALGVSIVKTPGVQSASSAKLVRDREAQSMGYNGVINRGEGTWPIIKPEMFTKLENTYNCYTIMFERNYRTADDLQRKTKESIEIYYTSNAESSIRAALGPLSSSMIPDYTTASVNSDIKGDQTKKTEAGA